MSDINEKLIEALQAAEKEGFLPNHSDDASKEADDEFESDEPDELVQQHLEEEAKKEAKSTQNRQVKVALLALLTAGDSCLAVDRCRYVSD